MKTEEIFEMLLGIDENLISSVGEDLENYRYSVGKAYPADEKHGFPWKRVLAAVVFAAAVMLGALFVVKYFDKTDIPIDNSNFGYSSDAGSSSTSPVSSGETSGITPQTKPIQGYYDDVFKEFLYDNPASGPRPTYYDAMDLMTRPEYGGLDSFYLVEAIELMKLSECEKLRGFDDLGYGKTALSEGADYDPSHVIYRVKVIEDLISGEKCGYETYIDMDMRNPIYQRFGDPPYAPGEKFTVALYNKAEDSDIVRSGAEYFFRFDIDDSNGDLKALVRTGRSAIGDSKIFGSTIEFTISKKSVITSTTLNPAQYIAEFKLSELCDFLRKDWKNIGDGNAASTGYDEDIQRIAEEYKNAGMTLSDEQIEKLINLYNYQNVNPGWERLPYGEGVITGEVDPNAPRLDPETAKKMISEHTDFDEILSEFRKVQRPDYIGGGHTVILYEIDDLGSEIVIFPMEKQIHYLKVEPDGTKHTETLFE